MNGQNEPATAKAQGERIRMARDKECKGSIRFATEDEKAFVTNVYVSRSMPGVDQAQHVFVSVSL